MRKCCRNCLCSSCLNVCGCCQCEGPKQTKTQCEQYRPFKQINIFEIYYKKPKKVLPRDKGYSDYGISKAEYRKLREQCRKGEYSRETLLNACTGFEYIAPWILLSVTQGKSYDRLEYALRLGRIPCGRTDFYGYRRMFYDALNHEVNTVQTH